MPSRAAVQVGVGEQQQQRAVAGERRLRAPGRAAARSPCRRAGSRCRRPRCPAASSRPRAGGQRPALDVVEELPDPPGARRRRCRRGSSARGRRSRRRRPAARPRSRAACTRLSSSVDERRVERAVEDHPADVGGEQVGVRRPDGRAVRRAEVGQLAVPERRRAGRRGPWPPRRWRRAGRGRRCCCRQPSPSSRHQPVGAAASRPAVSGSGSEAITRRAARPDARRAGCCAPTPRGSKPDDVEGLAQLGSPKLRAGTGGVVDARAARAARVDDQRPEPPRLCSRAGTLSSASSIDRPPGWA